MTTRFDRALPLILQHEGGYVNHPADPGGATNRGVTQRTYDSYRERNRRAPRDVRKITSAEVAAIYRGQYWNAVRADDLPSGMAYCVFDAAVNSGPGRAVRWLQACIGATVDGVVGNETITLTAKADPVALIGAYCDIRLAFMKRLRHWPTFGRGWSNRVELVRLQAIEWTSGGDGTYGPALEAGRAKASGPESLKTTVLDAIRDPAALSGAAGVLGSAGALSQGQGPVQWAIGAVLVIAALAALVWLVRRKA